MRVLGFFGLALVSLAAAALLAVSLVGDASGLVAAFGLIGLAIFLALPIGVGLWKLGGLAMREIGYRRWQRSERDLAP